MTDRETSATLLLRLRDLNDREAWDRFVQQYTPKIFAWCRQFGLQDSDASDVTQIVLAKLLQNMRSFQYDPSKGSFRGWLRTVSTNAIRDLQRTWSRPGQGTGDTQVIQQLAAIQDEEASAALAAQIEAEYERELLNEAESRVQLRVKPRTWKAYRLTAVEQLSGAEAGKQLDMPVAEVYVAKSRVIRMLREEAEKIEGEAIK